MLKRVMVSGTLVALLFSTVPAYATPPVGDCPSTKFHLVNLQQGIAEVQRYIPEATEEQIASAFEAADKNDDGLLCSQDINQHSPMPINYVDNVAHP